jgi:hypothetical protein
VLPAVQVAGPPAQGNGRLIVDVAEGPVPVYRARLDARKQDNGTRRPSFRFFDLPPELICKETPCVIDEPPGNILIGFPVLGCDAAIDYDLVHVGLDPSIYRRSLGIFEDKSGTEKILGIIGASVGGAAAFTGMVLLPVGAAGDNRGLAIAGGITLGAGALLTTIGALMIRHDAATYRPGSANHYEEETAVRAGPPASPVGGMGGAPVPGAPGAVPRMRTPLDIYPNYPCSWTSRRGGQG